MTVVLVADNCPGLEPLIRWLQHNGHEVACIAGHEALERLRRRVPDLVLLDVLMPDIPGLDLLRLIRQDPLLSGVRVVMLTVLSDPQTEQEARRLGAADYIIKGPDWARMVGEIQKHLLP